MAELSIVTFSLVPAAGVGLMRTIRRNTIAEETPMIRVFLAGIPIFSFRQFVDGINEY